jgi:FkbM family methyltransferase
MSELGRLLDIAGGPGSVGTVIDVGANDGADSLAYARRFPTIRFVAVEPTPELARRLESDSAGLENYTVVACAIGRADGDAVLKIRPLSVHNSLERVDHPSVARLGLPVDAYDVREEVRVPVRTLSSLCQELGVSAIDVLHVDAQGSDLDVLVSAGELLATVRAGVVEAGRRLHLYSNTVGRREIVAFLTERGFRVVRIRSNDRLNLEQNVFFARAAGGRWNTMHARRHMASADLAYWFAHRSPLRGPARRVVLSLRTRLRRAKSTLRR